MKKRDSKESFLLNSALGKAKSDIKDKMSAPDRHVRFMSAFSEYHPIVSKCLESGDLNSDDLISLVGKQNRWHKEVSDHFGYDYDSLSNAPQLVSYGRSVSELVAESKDTNQDESSIIAVADRVDRIIQDGGHIESILESGDTGISEDVLVSVKLAAFPESFRFDRILRGVGVTDEDRSKNLGLQITVGVELAKDLAYNYDKAGSVWDRERLFVGSLPHCLSIVQVAWLDLLKLSLPDALLSTEPSFISGHLKLLSSSILDQDMGYDDILFSRRALIEQIASVISKKLFFDNNSSLISSDISLSCASFRLKRFDEILSESWVEACDELLDRISKMSNEEQSDFMRGEGLRPMTLDVFWSIVDSKIDASFLDISFTPSIHELMQRSGKLLVALWGLSDTICKIRENGS
jgi:hypothetical protein